MNTSPSSFPSEAIAELLGIMMPYYGSGEVVLPGESWDAIVDGLKGVQKMSTAMERELGAFRILEAGRFAGGTMEEVATDEVGRLILDPDGKVVRPNFGRQS